MSIIILDEYTCDSLQNTPKTNMTQKSIFYFYTCSLTLCCVVYIHIIWDYNLIKIKNQNEDICFEEMKHWLNGFRYCWKIF